MRTKAIDFLSRYGLIVLLPFLVAACLIYIRFTGNVYTVDYYDYSFNQENGRVELDNGTDDVVTIEDIRISGEHCYVSLRAVRQGSTQIFFNGKDYQGVRIIYVHPGNVITCDEYFGDCNGMRTVLIAAVIYMTLVVLHFVRKLRESMAESIYRYKNIIYTGFIIFMVFALLIQLLEVSSGTGLIGALSYAMASMGNFVKLTFPVIIATTVIATVSNARLIRREGVTWRNMLSLILCIFLGILSVVPEIVSVIMDNSDLIDTHRWTGIGRFIEMMTVNTINSWVTYLECILIGTIIMSIKAARNIPSFDRDYILILGCKVGSDGKVTKLLKSRADRAIYYASLQKAAVGRDIFFIPSGGKGDDEVISEAQAIEDYLISCGIPKERIIKEDRSKSTEENFRFSMKKIEEHASGPAPKIAFATTNYHVFRSGLTAENLGIKAEGIGSSTKRYFWFNAFVREFIATIVSEKRRHILVALMIFLINLALVIMVYISDAILSFSL